MQCAHSMGSRMVTLLVEVDVSATFYDLSYDVFVLIYGANLTSYK
jgi:hypothetical protein